MDDAASGGFERLGAGEHVIGPLGLEMGHAVGEGHGQQSFLRESTFIIAETPRVTENPRGLLQHSGTRPDQRRIPQPVGAHVCAGALLLAEPPLMLPNRLIAFFTC